MNKLLSHRAVGRSLVCAVLLLWLCAGMPVPARGGAKSRGPSAARPQKRKPQRPAAARVVCNENSEARQTDFSGRSYTGTLRYSDKGITDGTTATLEIAGSKDSQTFTLRADGHPELKGRLTARTTCKYTGVTMMFGDLTPPRPNTPPGPPLTAISVRACKEDVRGEPGFVLRSKGETFVFSAPFRDPGGTAPSVEKEWGKCNGLARLRGNQPL